MWNEAWCYFIKNLDLGLGEVSDAVGFPRLNLEFVMGGGGLFVFYFLGFFGLSGFSSYLFIN